VKAKTLSSLTPTYSIRDANKPKDYFDVNNFGWLQRECIREILQKAREKK
jgi:hypothetical protein